METVTISREEYNEYVKLKEIIGENVIGIINPSPTEKREIDEALESGNCTIEEKREVESILNS